MLRPEEILVATDVELDSEIRTLLQDGESFSIEFDQGWYAEIRKLDSVVWWGSGFDERLLKLDAYGWLWLRKHPVKRSPQWANRSELTRERVAAKAHEAMDPEDLDPQEVASVYEAVRKKR